MVRVKKNIKLHPESIFSKDAKPMKYRILTSFLVTAVLVSSPAMATPKPWYFGWWPSHWENLTFEPYLEDAKQPHNTQWDRQKWETADWSAQRPNGSADVIYGFYHAKILHKQYLDDDMPVLEVGPGFYSLSGGDKRRVTKLIDEHYRITSDHLNAMYVIHDWRTHEPIGTYTAHGLSLQ